METKFWAFLPINNAIVCGNAKSELAKIIGITPDWFTFIGIWEFWPPYNFLPTTFLAYCTGIFLTASLINVTKAIVTNIITANTIANHNTNVPDWTDFTTLIKSEGILEIIPTNIMIELPFPSPFSVILSPIHINIILAETNVMITVAIEKILSDVNALFITPRVIPTACIIANTNAVYLVYIFIFFLPSSPDFWSSFKLSKPTVKSCIMIEAVI